MKLKRILVPVDFSTSSMQALEFAANLARPFNAELIVMFVIEPTFYTVPDYDDAQGIALGELAKDQRRVAEAAMAQIERRYAKRRLRLTTRIQDGLASSAVVNAAKRDKADLIVIATHGRAGLPRLLMGSVAERVLRTATCPVLTLPANAAAR